MKKAILATKVGMTQIFNENGVLIPVTVLQATPNVVTQVKTVENDGYAAVQVGLAKLEKFSLISQEKDTLLRLVLQIRDFLESSSLKTLLNTQ